jgi:hypothetical protein
MNCVELIRINFDVNIFGVIWIVIQIVSFNPLKNL